MLCKLILVCLVFWDGCGELERLGCGARLWFVAVFEGGAGVVVEAVVPGVEAWVVGLRVVMWPGALVGVRALVGVEGAHGVVCGRVCDQMR